MADLFVVLCAIILTTGPYNTTGPGGFYQSGDAPSALHFGGVLLPSRFRNWWGTGWLGRRLVSKRRLWFFGGILKNVGAVFHFGNPCFEYTYCDIAKVGHYAPEESSSQIQCEPGKYGNRNGLAECIPCPPNQVQPHPGQASCNSCPAGMAEDDRITCTFAPTLNPTPFPTVKVDENSHVYIVLGRIIYIYAKTASNNY